MSRGAQKLGVRWSMCAKKKRYPSESEAQKTANAAMRFRPHQPLRVYDCAECNGWHITKQRDINPRSNREHGLFRHHQPEAGGVMPFKYANLIDRIIANSVLSDENFYNGTPCWEWIGRATTNRNGTKYPRMSRRITKGPRKGKVSMEFVHRVVVRGIKGRRLTKRSVAMHLCNNTLCVNPDHLGGGSQKANMQQAVREGRHRNAHSQPATHHEAAA